MKIVGLLIKRVSVISGVFLTIIIVIYLRLTAQQFKKGLQFKIQSDTEAAIVVTSRTYMLGDLLSLRSQLTDFAKNAHWTFGKFVDKNGTTIWEHGNKKYTSDEDMLNLESAVYVEDNLEIGKLEVQKQYGLEKKDYTKNLLFSFILGLSLWLIFILTTWKSSLKLLKPVETLVDDIRQEARDLHLVLDDQTKLDELRMLKAWFSQVSTEWRTVQNKLIQIERTKITADIATQVAHDIRSPLAALGALEPQMHMLPENTRILVRSAISRIQDIANNLLANSKGQSSGGTTQEPLTTQLVTAIIDPLISEKRLQLRSKPGVELIWNMGPEAYGLFANIQPIEFKRILSNLINNAAEAMPKETGRILVTASVKDSNLEITIKDNGRGIDAQILRKIGTRGETHGKDGGTGLGLAHAKEYAQKWGGTLEIDSAPGQGTAVTLRLPQAQAPDWFVTELNLKPHTKIYLLDDDYSIHRIWKGRLDSTTAQTHGVILKTFTQAKDFEAAVLADKPDLCLLDFELAGQDVTGLDVAEKLGIGDHSILVSSRFEEPRVHSRALELKLKIIPKGMAGLVPIHLPKTSEAAKPVGPDAILIDDDSLVQMTWQFSAKSKGKKLTCFSTPSAFEIISDSISLETPIYIDVSLGNGVKGDDVAKKLFGQGFKNLYLATGHNPDTYSHLTFLKGVIGKDPPWSA